MAAIKTYGAEYKAFIDDDEYWRNVEYVDDDLVSVNGKKWDGDSYLDIPDDAEVRVEGGILYGAEGPLRSSYSSFFGKWKTKSAASFFIVRIPMSKEAELTAFIASIGGETLTKRQKSESGRS